METARIRFVGLVLGLAICSLSHAGVVYVDDDAALGGDGTSWETAFIYLQDALVVAQAGDDIRVAQGIYKPDRSLETSSGSGDRSATFAVVEGVSLKGGYAGLLGIDPNERDVDLYVSVLQGDLAGDDQAVADPCDLMEASDRQDNSYHVVKIQGGTLEGFEVTGGYAHERKVTIPYTIGFITNHAGGGIWGFGTIRDCHIHDNYAEEMGGGLWYGEDYMSDSGTVYLEGCRFEGNATRSWGGGLSLLEAEAKLSDCEFTENWAGSQGGGVQVREGDVLLTNCSVLANNTGISGIGGGIIVKGGLVTVEGCVFKYNRSYNGAGVASWWDANLRLLNCLVSMNTATMQGGAIIAGTSESVQVTGCILIGNRAEEGGAVFVISSQVEMKSCTILMNLADSGAFLSSKTKYIIEEPLGVVEIANCILGNDVEIWNNASSIVIDSSDIQDAAEFVDPCEWVVLGEGNLYTDPCFVDPGYWDDNDTPDDANDDFFVEGDYHLKSQAGRWDPNSESWVQDEVTSPCIDAGDSNSPIMHEPFPNGGVINMGAYGGTVEASKSYFGCPLCETIIAGDINGDCVVDCTDLAILGLHWLEQGELAEVEDEDEGDVGR